MQPSSINLVGRILVSFIFIISGLSKIAGWQPAVGYMQSHGVPFPGVLLAAAIFIEVACGIGVLIGYKTRLASAVLFFYLIPVTFVFHGFWAFEGIERQVQMVNFLKNLAIMGGLLVLNATGSSAKSVDYRIDQHRQSREREKGDRSRIRIAS